MAMKVAMSFSEKLHICFSTGLQSSYEKFGYLAQRVQVSEILRHFPNLPTRFRSVYKPTGTIIATFYREMPRMLHAKYQPNQPSDSGEEVV